MNPRKECTFEEEPAVSLFSPLSPRDLCYVKVQAVFCHELLVRRPLGRSVYFHVYRGATVDVHGGGNNFQLPKATKLAVIHERQILLLDI